MILRDPYEFPETSLALPPKPAVKKRSSKRIADNARSNDIQSDDDIIEIDTADNSETKISKLILYWFLINCMQTRTGRRIKGAPLNRICFFFFKFM